MVGVRQLPLHVFCSIFLYHPCFCCCNHSWDRSLALEASCWLVDSSLLLYPLIFTSFTLRSEWRKTLTFCRAWVRESCLVWPQRHRTWLSLMTTTCHRATQYWGPNIGSVWLLPLVFHTLLVCTTSHEFLSWLSVSAFCAYSLASHLDGKCLLVTQITTEEKVHHVKNNSQLFVWPPPQYHVSYMFIWLATSTTINSVDLSFLVHLLLRDQSTQRASPRLLSLAHSSVLRPSGAWGWERMWH